MQTPGINESDLTGAELIIACLLTKTNDATKRREYEILILNEKAQIERNRKFVDGPGGPSRAD